MEEEGQEEEVGPLKSDFWKSKVLSIRGGGGGTEVWRGLGMMRVD